MNEKQKTGSKGDKSDKSATDSINPDYKAIKKSQISPKEYAGEIMSGNKTLLSRAITLLESSKPEYRNAGKEILQLCLPHSGNSVRVGITGVPGAGKSTFIEAIGSVILKEGKKVAVLTVDPSSSRSKGSILGDKTRMPGLSNEENAYIRPSPTSGTLGGVTLRTRETILLCEAAGYDTILVETVGVGQSETVVHSMVDFFLLIMIAGAGDELQGIKRGIVEMADIIAINKAEGGNKKAANQARAEFANALSLYPATGSGWKPKVVTCSALKGNGITEIWSDIKDYVRFTKQNGFFNKRRSEQAVWWMYQAIETKLKESFYESAGMRKKINAFEKEVKKGKISSFEAADQLFEIYKKKE